MIKTITDFFKKIPAYLSGVWQGVKNARLRTHLPWLITVCLAILFWVQTCNYNRDYKEQKAIITQLDLDNQELKTVVNKKDQEIKKQTSLVTANQAQINKLTDTIFDLKRKDAKNTETIAYFKEIVKIGGKNIKVPYLDTVRMKRFSDSVSAQCEEVIRYYEDSTINVPRKAGVQTKDYQIGATITKDELLIDSIYLPDVLQLRFVEHKGGLFRRKSIEVQFFHSNPYVKTLGSQSVFYKPKRGFRWLEKALILGAGVYLGSRL